TKKTATARPTPTATPTPRPTATPPPGLDEEAFKGCVAEFEKVYSKCDGSWISEIILTTGGAGNYYQSHDVLELRDVNILASKVNLSTADKLNGREWEGHFLLKSTVWRYHSRSDNTATKWEDSTSMTGLDA